MIILVSGWPACGKGTYSRWLRDDRGFIHLDLESPHFQASVLHPVWEACWGRLDFQPFLQELKRIHPRWVLDWGFPPRYLNIVEALKSRGVKPWFFVPETEDVSRATWLAREQKRNAGVTADFWEAQAIGLRTADTKLRGFFGNQILQTLRADGSWLVPEQVARTVVDVADDPAV